ncbi:hypothetical protein [Glutamicibacter ardleyensis]|uniref:hypothetical protein n=1 Tax=Glutamicibacter ardleyensis TaxID=225894 RepID=UPI003FCFBEC7
MAGSPDTDYGLEDAMPGEDWVAVTSSPLTSLIPLHATLNGCIEALNTRTVSAAEVERVDGPPPHGTAITPEDMKTARSWLANTLAANVDEDGRQSMIDREATVREWIGNPTRITSLVMALVIIAAAAAAG